MKGGVKITEDLGRLLKQAASQLTRHFDRFAQKYDLTATQMAVIDYLCRYKQKAIFQRDIEYEFLIQRSTASTLLKRMEDKDLLYRESNKNDARQKEVKLTNKSLELEKVIIEYMNHNQQSLKDHFSEDDINALYKVLHGIIRLKQ